MNTVTTPRRVFRARFRLVVLTVAFLAAAALVGVGAAVTTMSPVARGAMVLAALLFALVGLRCARMRLVTGPDGLHLHGVFMSRLLPWSSIRQIVADDTETDLGLPVRAPLIYLADGKKIKARAASSYALGRRPTVADQIAADLEELRATAIDPA
jgi:hypothetical protein